MFWNFEKNWNLTDIGQSFDMDRIWTKSGFMFPMAMAHGSLPTHLRSTFSGNISTIWSQSYILWIFFCDQVINKWPDVTYVTRHSWSRVEWRWVGDGPWAFGSKNPDFVQSPSVSKDCPNLCPIPHFSNYCDQLVTYVTKLWILDCDQVINMWPNVTKVTRHSWSKVGWRWAGSGRWAVRFP